MKHDGSTSGRSTERGKCQRIFFNAWNLHGMTGAKTISARSRKKHGGSVSGVPSRWRATAEERTTRRAILGS